MLDISEAYQEKFSKYKFIDLFAGIGGFHYALTSYGAKCVFASEWDKHASKVYENNFNVTPFGDITKISETDIPEHDIICGGFPCQAFSVSGKQKGFQDTRGTLFFDILRIADYHKPKLLFLENVKNIQAHDGGNTIKVIIDNLDKLGYKVFYKLLNTSNYGLPQNRERVYFVCFRKDLNVLNFEFPKPINNHISLESILEDNTDNKYNINRQDVVITKQLDLGNNLFDEPNKKNKPIQIGYVNKGGQGERIYHPTGHSITLSAYGGGAGAKTGLYLINNKLRKLTERECAKLQGFPDSFKLHENRNQCYKQFGNSVSINVLQHILKNIIDSLA
jgi:DNA (cytosine-5)-methyltransferase 1